MVSGHQKSTGIPRVKGLSSGPSGFGASHHVVHQKLLNGLYNKKKDL